jgi:tetratricopeptide (TPR) repeat protein
MKNRLPPTWNKQLKTAPLTVERSPQGSRAEEDAVRLAALHQREGRRAEAEQLCLKVLARNPRNADALYLAGTLALDVQNRALAVTYLQRAVHQKPENAFFRIVLAETLESAGEVKAAEGHFRRALAEKPSMIPALCGVGRSEVRAGRAKLALPLFEKAYRLDRSHKLARAGLAEALIALGRMDDAAKHLEEAIDRRQNVGWAWVTLAANRKFSGDSPELARIQKELSNPALPDADKNLVHYAAGKILNDLKRYDEAIDHFQIAKIVARRDFDLTAYGRWIDNMMDIFDPELIAAKRPFGNPSEAPVFIIGMPRSGTTLVEQICASHPEVHGAGEITKLWQIAQSFGVGSPKEFRKNVETTGSEQLLALSSEYLTFLRERAPDAIRVTDKMPQNFQFVGFIALLFPNARIIRCVRDPVDTCLSWFMTPFNDMRGYNADLDKLGLYYREYDRLMRHWNAVLPGRIHEVRYEALIADPEAESRRLIDYLGLPWDDACLRFYESDRSVTTPSSWQVRQPIYASSVKRWKNYEGKIQPLIDALGDLAEGYHL